MNTFGANSGVTAGAATSVRFNDNVTLANGDTATTLSGNVTLDGLNWSSFDGITLGAVTLSTGAVSLDSNAGNIAITTLTGAQDLTLAAGVGAGTTTISGAVSNLGDGTGAALTINNAATGLVTFQSTFGANSGVTAGAATSITFLGNATLAAGNTPSTFGTVTFQNASNDATHNTLTLPAGTTTTILTAMTLDGLDADDRVLLRSSTGGATATTDFTGASTFTGDFLDIQDSTVTDNSTGITLELDPTDSLDSGNTTGWFLSVSTGGGAATPPAVPTEEVDNAQSGAPQEPLPGSGEEGVGSESGTGSVEPEPTPEEVAQAFDEELGDASPEQIESILPYFEPTTTDVLVDSETGVAFIADGTNDSVVMVDMNTGEVLRTLETGSMPVSMILSEDKLSLFVYNLADGTVSQISLATGQTLETFEVGPPGTRIGLTMTPQGLVVTSSDGRTLKTVPTSALR